MFFKAFKKGLICRDKQYKENEVFEESGASSCCQKGVMHFCERPLDTLNYYPLIDGNGDLTEFAVIEPLDHIIRDKNKCASRKIKIGTKLKLADLIRLAVQIDINTNNASSGNCSQLALNSRMSIAMCAGSGGMVKGKLGCWIVLTEWKEIGNNLIPFVKTGLIDGEVLKEDTWYILKNEEFVEFDKEE